MKMNEVGNKGNGERISIVAYFMNGYAVHEQKLQQIEEGRKSWDRNDSHAVNAMYLVI
jgi:hypothetical protein